MTFAEIFSIEDDNVSKIYLHKEGGFWKIYEHSAYLFHRYVSAFKLSRRYIEKVNRYVIYLSIPESSIKKWLHAYPYRQENERLIVYDFPQVVDEVSYHHWCELASIEANSKDRFTVYTSVIENQPVYKTAYDTMLHVSGLTKHVEKNLWDPFAIAAKRLAYEVAYGVRIIYDVADREKHIDGVQSACKELLFILQFLKDKKQISIESFAVNSERIVSVSKQLEGLRRKVQA